MFHPDAVPLFKVQNNHVGTCLESCFIISHQFDLWHVVEYDVYHEILLAVLDSGDVEYIRSSHRGREDSCTRVVSITDIYKITLMKIKVPLFQVVLVDVTPAVKATFCFKSVKKKI